MDSTNIENDDAKEIREDRENRGDLEGLYDLAIPLSMPITVIRELVEKFDVEPVLRPGKMDMTGEVMDREILVLRGTWRLLKRSRSTCSRPWTGRLQNGIALIKKRNIRSTMRSSPV